jgi:ATP-binding cassette subfamily F protein uup
MQNTQNILRLQQAQLAFGHVPLLDNTEFTIQEKERITLIGRNGTGKSTLLKVCAGLIPLDTGQCVVAQNVRVVYVPQETPIILNCVLTDLLLEKVDADHQYDSSVQSLMYRYIDTFGLSELYEQTLMFAEGESQVLSGGQQKRIALLQASDVLMLDEPTNHLDYEAIEQLLIILKTFGGTIVMVTHDRYVMDQVSTRICELDRGKIRTYEGNFTAYQRLKEEQLAVEFVDNAKFDKFLAQEEEWIRKGVKARRTRDEGRVKRLEQLRLTRQARREQQGNVNMQIQRGDRSAQQVCEAIDVCFNYPMAHEINENNEQHKPHNIDQTWLLKNINLLIQRGDKIAFVGKNGVGKTTLLKLLLGQLEPSSGTIKLGHRLEIAYFDQMREQLDPEVSVAETISPGSEWIEIGDQRKHVMSYLGDFLFSPQRANSPVKSLSGGERNRLLLARLLAKKHNVLVLDEPTNDLDIETLELLEEQLQTYAGTVFLISHDRWFVDQIATQILAYDESTKNWVEYAGGYEDYLLQKSRSSNNNSLSQAREQQKKNSKPNNVNPSKDVLGSTSSASSANEKITNSITTETSEITEKAKKAKKLSFNEKRRLEELPVMISELEKQLIHVENELQKSDQGAGKLMELSQKQYEYEEKLMSLYEELEVMQGKL